MTHEKPEDQQEQSAQQQAPEAAPVTRLLSSGSSVSGASRTSRTSSGPSMRATTIHLTIDSIILDLSLHENARILTDRVGNRVYVSYQPGWNPGRDLPPAKQTLTGHVVNALPWDALQLIGLPHDFHKEYVLRRR